MTSKEKKSQEYISSFRKYNSHILFVSDCIYLFTYLFIYLFINLSIYLYIYLGSFQMYWSIFNWSLTIILMQLLLLFPLSPHLYAIEFVNTKLWHLKTKKPYPLHLGPLNALFWPKKSYFGFFVGFLIFSTEKLLKFTQLVVIYIYVVCSMVSSWFWNMALDEYFSLANY